MSLPNIDLNLLKLFSSLYKTESVTISAEELNLSQSACSHALQRLRERLGDELFIRIDNRMLPTVYAKKLAEDLLPGLALIDKSLNSLLLFNPEKNHQFRISATDFTSWCMQPFISHLGKNYPEIDVEFTSLKESMPKEFVQTEDLDFICGLTHKEEHSEGISQLLWFADHYVCVRTHTHRIQGQLTLKEYLSFRHILVTPRRESRGMIDIALSKIGKRRRIAVKMKNLLAAPFFIQETSHLLVLPNIYAHQIKNKIPLLISTIPFKTPNYSVSLYWEKTRHKDPKINWFIQEFSRFIKSKEGAIQSLF